MQCGSTDQQDQTGARRAVPLVHLAAFALILGVDVTMAQPTTAPTVTLACTGPDTIPDATLAGLCGGLHKSLAAKYPDARFSPINGGLADGTASVTLEAFVATNTALDVQLSWRLPGSDDGHGPRMGLSIADKDLTPAIQQQFLNRLVQNTALPF